MFIISHGWRYPDDVAMWTGFKILEEGTFVLGHIDRSGNNDIIRMNLDLVTTIEPRFQVLV